MKYSYFDVSNYDKNNLKELDSIRGLMAIFILGCHFFAAFGYIFPKFGIITPFKLLTNATIGLCYFFLLSGFVISYSQQNKMKKASILKYAFNRFWRLFPPIFISILLMYIFQKNNWLTISDKTAESSSWLQSLYQFKENTYLINPLYDAIYNTYIGGNVVYNCNLWAIRFEFLVPMLLIIIGPLMHYRYTRISLIIIDIFLFVWGSEKRWFWMGIMLLGPILCYYLRLLPYDRIKKWFLTLGLFFIILTNIISIESVLDFSLHRIINLISSIVILIMTINEKCKFKNILLNNRIICSLGKASYEIYVFHLFALFTISPLIIIFLKPTLGNYISIIVSYIITIIIVVIFSLVFHEKISKVCSKYKIK